MGGHEQRRDRRDDCEKQVGCKGFQRGDKDRDDFFAETPPLEAKRMLLGRAVTRRRDRKERKLLFMLEE